MTGVLGRWVNAGTQLLVKQALRLGEKQRQVHTRLAKRAALKAGHYAHARQFKRMWREQKLSG